MAYAVNVISCKINNEADMNFSPGITADAQLACMAASTLSGSVLYHC